ncbi:MAG: M56 family metallopeptidase, partial [Thermoanaerobaculia bacterium]
MSEIVLANPAAQAMARALVQFLWQGALVGLATAGALSLLSKSRASLRYTVAAGALLVMAALPWITAFRIAQSPAGPAVSAPSAAASVARPVPALASAPRVEPQAQEITFGSSLLPGVFGLWLAGVAVLSAWHLGGLRRVRRLPRQARPAGDAIEALTRDLCRRLKIGRAVTLLESAAVTVPMVIGWLRPVVLVPASTLAGLTPLQLEAILAHELAHVRRHDYLVNLLQAAVETLLFYHPAVWWVSAQVRKERESCCDDLAVAVCGDRLGYARALVDLERMRSTPRLALAATGGSLSDRVRRLVGAPARPSGRPWAAGLLVLALLPAGAALQSACAKPSTQEAADRSEARLRGQWWAEKNGDNIRLKMTLRKAGWGSWTSVDDYTPAELTGFLPGPDVPFELRRDAGTFKLRGSFDGRKGSGAMSFAPNLAYAKAMGYRGS